MIASPACGLAVPHQEAPAIPPGSYNISKPTTSPPLRRDVAGPAVDIRHSPSPTFSHTSLNPDAQQYQMIAPQTRRRQNTAFHPPFSPPVHRRHYPSPSNSTSLATSRLPMPAGTQQAAHSSQHS
jgi:hypothetical protein